MTVKKLLTAVLVAASLSSPVQAIEGNDLHRWCSGKHPRNQGNCDGFIMGTSEAMQLFEEGAAAACFPDHAIMNQQIIDITKKYLADHPERRHESASALIVDALVEAFPCKGGE